MDRGKKLLKNTIVLMFGTILTKGLNFIMAPLFTRWLSTTEYGTFDLLCTYVTLLIPTLALGTHHAVFRFLLDAKSDEEHRVIVTNTLFINMIGFLLYFAILIIICFIKPSLRYYAGGLTILLITQTIQNYMCMYIRGIKKLKLYSTINIICTAAILLFVSLFVRMLSLGLNGMILGYASGYLVSMSVGFILLGVHKEIKISTIKIDEIRRLLNYSLPMIPNSIAWWIVNISDRMIVSFALGVEANAILAVSHKIPNLCTTVYDIFQTAWVENASESINDSDWESYLEKTLNVMSRVCISVSILIITTNFFLYDLLFTGDYAEGKLLVPIFAFALIFASISQTLGSVFVAEYNSKTQGLSMLEAGIVNIVVHLALIHFIGIYASAISTLVAYVFLFAIRYKEIREKYELRMDYKTISLCLLILVYMVLGYICNSSVIQYVLLISSVVIIYLFNKDTLRLVLKKMRRV